jgi:hypothetical protein
MEQVIAVLEQIMQSQDVNEIHQLAQQALAGLQGGPAEGEEAPPAEAPAEEGKADINAMFQERMGK